MIKGRNLPRQFSRNSFLLENFLALREMASAPFAIRRATLLVKSRRCAWVCALSLTMFTRREATLYEHCKYRRMRTLSRHVYWYGRGEKLRGLRVERRMDLHLPPLLLFFFFFILLFFSHYCSLWLRETTVSINMFSRVERPEETMLYLALFCLSDIIILFLLYISSRKKLIEEEKLESN